MEKIDNVRETKREIKKKLQGGGTVYELTVVQEYFEQNVKNMLVAWEDQSQGMSQWLKDYHLKHKDAEQEAIQQLEATKEMLLNDFKLDKDAVWESWKDELQKKQEWIDNFDEHVKKAKAKAKEEMDKMRIQVKEDLERNEKAISQWKNALQS